MGKKVSDTMKAYGELVFESYYILISSDYLSYIFRPKLKGKEIKKIYVKEDGLYDNEHPRGHGKPKKVTKFNSRWVYALDKRCRGEIYVGGSGNAWKATTDKNSCLNKRNCKQRCQVRKSVSFYSYKYANFEFHHEYFLDKKAFIFKNTRILTEKNTWAIVKGMKENVCKRKMYGVKTAITMDEKQERNEKIIQYYRNSVTKTRLSEHFGLSIRMIDLILKDEVKRKCELKQGPFKKKEGKNEDN